MKVANDEQASALGHHWQPGEAIDLDHDEAHALVSIRDGGFYIVEDDAPAAAKPAPKRARKVTEVDPDATHSEVDDAPDGD